MSIFQFDWTVIWSLDASETGERTKCPWVGVVGLIAWGERAEKITLTDLTGFFSREETVN